MKAAKQEKKREIVHFAAKLMRHAKTEEQVLVGEYLKLLRRGHLPE